MQGLSEDVGSSIRDPSNWRPTKPTMQHEGEDCSVWTPLPKTVLGTIMPQGIWPLRGVLGRNCRGEGGLGRWDFKVAACYCVRGVSQNFVLGLHRRTTKKKLVFVVV